MPAGLTFWSSPHLVLGTPLLVAAQHTPTHLPTGEPAILPEPVGVGADLQSGCQGGLGQPGGLEGDLAPPSFQLAVLFPGMGPWGLLLQQVPAW